jgi:mono/diheme cytochrome c family protein
MKRSRLFPGAVAGLLAVVALSGCDVPDQEERRARMHLPPDDFVADAFIGGTLFQGNCATCHGADARGTDKGPPLIDPVYRPGHHADMVFHLAVKDGAKQHHWHFGDMPPVPGLTPEQVGHVIAWVRQEQRRAGIK